LLSNALFFGALAFTRTGRFFYDAFSAVQSRGSVFADWGWFRARRRRTGGTAGVPGLMERLAARLPWLGVDTRAMMVKDARMFWRDTTQWGQSVMLFGLLGVYIINLRHFSQQITHPFWTDLISYLNLGACALNLATITTRFVYPQFSLEGKRLWIVGLAPLGLAGVLKTKLALALTTALALTLSLIWLSCRMLELSAARTVYFAVAIAVMACTLTALAVGLGALYPNFKEENPGKIVSGFGGTFCLVLSFVYILGSVGLLAWGSPWGNFGVASYLRSLGCMAGFVALSFALGWVPLRLGLRRVKTFEL
jgi:ABC-2 type transport system permease protein